MRTFNNLLLVFMTIMSSCGTYYYMPTQQQVPLFNEKNELQAHGGVDEHGFHNFQLAYSINNSFGIQINTLSKNQDGTSRNYGNLIEAGPGYHYSISKYFVFETFAGYGKANIDNNDLSGHLSFNRVYVNPIIGFHSKYADLAYSMRYCYLTYHYHGIDPSNSHNFDHYWEIYNFDNITQDFIEPALTLRLGYKYCKLQGQYNWLIPQGTAKFNYIDHNFSISLFVSLPLDNIFFRK